MRTDGVFLALCSDNMSLAWNWPQGKYLHHRKWQLLWIRTFPLTSSPGRLLSIYHCLRGLSVLKASETIISLLGAKVLKGSQTSHRGPKLASVIFLLFLSAFVKSSPSPLSSVLPFWPFPFASALIFRDHVMKFRNKYIYYGYTPDLCVSDWKMRLTCFKV